MLLADTRRAGVELIVGVTAKRAVLRCSHDLCQLACQVAAPCLRTYFAHATCALPYVLISMEGGNSIVTILL